MDKRDKFIASKSVVILLSFFVIFMLVGSIIRGQSSYDYSFYGLLTYLGSVPTFNASFFIKDFVIKADWGLFNFLRDFINPFVSITGFGLFLTTNLINLLVFVFYILTFIIG